MDYLDSLSSSPLDASFAALVSEVAALYQKKLWHQLSMKMFDLIEAGRSYFSQGGQLLKFYHGFLIKLNGKIKCLAFVKAGLVVSHSMATPVEAIKFLTDLKASIKECDEESGALLSIEVARRRLANGEADAVKEALEACRIQVDGSAIVMDATVYSLFYLALCEYHKVKGTPNEYYQNSILYLTYTPLSSLDERQQVQLASDLCLSAILGANIYNFGELLEQPILHVLEKNATLNWLPSLLKAFNTGNIAEFTRIFTAIKATNPLIAMNGEFLNQKIRILAFIELAFARPASNRTFPFSVLASHCQVDLLQVEWLIMKALSLGVVKGIIDEVNQQVRIHWIQPRVLDKQQLLAVQQRLRSWAAQVDEASIMVDNHAQQIIGH